MIARTDTAHEMPRFRVRIGAVAALVLSVFIVISHIPTLPGATRQGGMMAAILTAMLLVLLGLSRIGLVRILSVTVPALFLVVIFGIHNHFHPALNDYAVSKRALFPIVILSTFVVFPLVIHAYDRELKSTIRVLVAVSVLFALLAFVAPTGENIRRSGIELNPLLHAKLLFFPFFLLLARPSNSLRSLLLMTILLLCFAACLRTGSRSPIAVVIAILCFDAILTAKLKGVLRMVVYVGLILVILFPLIEFLPREIAERFSLDALGGQSEEGNRLFLFTFAFELIARYQGGIGMGNMAEYYWINAPHNIVIEAVMDFGFLVSFPYVLLLTYTTMLAIAGLRSYNMSSRFIALWYFFFLANSMIGGEMTFPSMLLYMPMGLLILHRMRPGHPVSNKRGGRNPSSKTVGTTAQILSPDMSKHDVLRRRCRTMDKPVIDPTEGPCHA